MAVANCDDIIFNEVQDEALLQYDHTDAPIYIPSLKVAISVGHYVSVCNTWAFIFLVEDIMSCQFHILGMRNAFIIRYKYCFQMKQLVGENVTEYLRQEIWGNLCHFGEKQGLFPKPMFQAYVSPNFTSYLTRLLNSDLIPSHLVVSSDPQHCINLYLRYQIISVRQTFQYFEIDGEEQLKSFASIFGMMSIFGIHVRMPWKEFERGIRVLDAVNCTSKVELFIGQSHVKCKLHCFKHLVGEPNENGLLSYHIQPSLPPPQMNITVETQSMAALAIGSKFDHNGSLHEVGTSDLTNVICVCKWGAFVGS
jgi:hypothetical protein